MTKHPNCEFIVAFAEGKEVEFKYQQDSEWMKVHYLDRFDGEYIFRIKPKTRMINGFEVPCAMDKEPTFNQQYFIPDIGMDEFYCNSNYNTDWDGDKFNRGICFSNKEDAIAVAKAMLGIDPHKQD